LSEDTWDVYPVREQGAEPEGSAAGGQPMSREPVAPTASGRAAPSSYSDGHPLDQVHYREYKVILRSNRFTRAESFHEFARLVRHSAKEQDVALFKDQLGDNRIREVLFYDTPAFDLYNRSFILRRRTVYQNGWLEDNGELVLKFRHAEQSVAAAVDMRAAWPGSPRVKFKEELLCLRQQLGGLRSLFSHGCSVVSPHTMPGPRLGDTVRVFPALAALGLPPDTPVGIVNDLHVEEVLADVGELHFGHGIQAGANVGIWRHRGTGAPLVGEFAFQIKLQNADELHRKARKRADDFFRAVQLGARDWVKLAVTKTGVVYGTGTTAVTNHE
jgi:hypothetical protein